MVLQGDEVHRRPRPILVRTTLGREGSIGIGDREDRRLLHRQIAFRIKVSFRFVFGVP